MSLSKLWETVKDKEAWRAADLATEQQLKKKTQPSPHQKKKKTQTNPTSFLSFRGHKKPHTSSDAPFWADYAQVSCQ